MSQQHWFVVVGTTEAEVGGPLENGQTINFEGSGLSFRWRGDMGRGKLAVWDARSNGINVGDLGDWPVDGRFRLPSIKIMDSDGETWVIFIARTQVEAEAIDPDDDVLAAWFGGSFECEGYEDDDN